MTISAADLMDDLSNLLGENSDACTIRGFLDTGIPEANKMLTGEYSGGIPQGRVTEIFGPSSSGKTFLATQAMAAVQKLGGIAFLSDHERSFDPKFAETLGLNINPSVFKHLKPETFEDSIDMFWRTAKLIRDKGLPMEVPCIWVFDSVAAMIPKSKLYDDKGNLREVGSFKMNDALALAKSCSQSYPTVKMFAEDYNFAVLLLNQIRLKPGVLYGDPTTTPGGNAAEFYADTRLSLSKKDLVVGTGKDKEVIGFEINAKAVKNKIGRPQQKASWQIRFNEHELGVTIDQIATNVDYLIRLGKINQAGNRVEWDGKKMYPSQLIELLKSQPDGNDQLIALLND